MNAKNTSTAVENGTTENVSKKIKYPNTSSGISFGDVDHIVNADGQYLFCRYWKPDTEIKALMFHAHGFAEHSAPSKVLAERMMELGIYSFAHDDVAHGESQGLRGHILDYKVMVRDIWQHIDLIRPEYPEVPIFIYAHSMGGALALIAAHERPNFFRGILLSAPYITPSEATATPVKMETYMNDPLNDKLGMRASFAIQFLAIAKKMKEILPQTTGSFFVAHSEDDKICDVSGSRFMAEVSKSEDLTLKIYNGAMHKLERETPEFVEAYFGEVLQWIKERIL
uniref:monoglyceride lipase-like isoform X2 n=1 Tax=Styela clava TaxID=7725 RepID=UPI001939789E|nr:monoglyceride lipase-like isoform X2 [Styela clava]